MIFVKGNGDLKNSIFCVTIVVVKFASCSYYVRSQDCSLAQFYSPQVLDTLRQKIKDADAVIGKTAPGLPTWLGETSSASGGGAEGISDRFVAGFM